MSFRLYRLLRDNKGQILLRTVRAARNSIANGLTFDDLYSFCDELIEGYLDLIGNPDSGRLERLFMSSMKIWTDSSYGIEQFQRITNHLKAASLPIIENYHMPQTRAKLKLEMIVHIKEMITLFSSFYYDAITKSSKEEEKIFERIFKESGDCIFSITPCKTIKIMNPAMERFLGIKKSEALGKKCYEIIRWRNREKTEFCKISCPFMESFSKGLNTVYIEGILVLKGRGKIWTGTTASCVRDSTGGIQEVILVMRDITNSKEIQQKLEQEIKAYETLASSARGIELKIPCLSEFAITARAQAELIAKRLKFSEEKIQDIKTAVGEACDNAIEHGNSPYGIDIRYRIDGPNLIIEVEDYGSGFDPDDIEYTLPSPYVEGGRGLFLIKNFADSVRIISKKGQGTKVTMEIFRRPASNLSRDRFSSSRTTWRSKKRISVM